MLPSRIFLFGDHITRWDSVVDAGHLWYLEHVLLFSVVYALWKKLRPSVQGRDLRRPAPGALVTIAALLVVAILCGIVRIWSPIDR